MDDTIKIEHNSKEINQALTELAQKVKKPNKILRKVGHTIRLYVDRKFETEGEFEGTKWQQWSESWKERREREGKADGQIMSYTGELRKSIEDKISGSVLEVGTNKVYAAIHNFGGAVKKRKSKKSKIGKKGKTAKSKTQTSGSFEMPKREYMAFESKLIEQITDEIMSELTIEKYRTK